MKLIQQKRVAYLGFRKSRNLVRSWSIINGNQQEEQPFTETRPYDCCRTHVNQNCLSLRPCGLRAEGVQTHSRVKLEMEQFLGSIGSIFGDRTPKPQNDFIDSMQDLCGVSSIADILLLISRCALTNDRLHSTNRFLIHPWPPPFRGS